jgi:hypothetical protein
MKMTGELYQVAQGDSHFKSDCHLITKSPEPVGSGLEFISSVSSRDRFTGRARSGGLSGCSGLDDFFHGRDYTTYQSQTKIPTGSDKIEVPISKKETPMYTTDMYEGVLAETVTITGANGDRINAYMARPLGEGKFPAMVLAHHMPGWDAWYRETTYKFALNGYVTITPNLYFRAGHGTPEDVAAKVHADGGIPDEQAVGDLEGAMKHVRGLEYVNGKVGIFGTCSGGRHAYLAACRVKGYSTPSWIAGADAW